MSTKKIAVSTLWQIASQAVMALLSIITVKFVAVGLTRELAGTYNSAYGFLQFFGILADAGLYAVAVREMARAKDEGQTLGTLVLLRLIVTGVAFSIAIAIAWSIPAWRASPLALAATIAAFVPIFTLLAGIQRSVFQVHYRMGAVFAAEVLQRVVTAGLIAATVLMGVRESDDPRMVFWFLAVGGIGALVLFCVSSVLARRIVKIRATWDPETMKRLLKLALPFGLAYLCMALYRNMDVTLIALLRPDFQLQNALYGFALRANDMAFLLPTFLLNSTLPLLSKKIDAKEDATTLVRTTFSAITLLSLTAGLTAIVWSRPLMQLLTTEKYLSTPGMAGADTALMALGPSMILNGFVLFSFYTLLSLGEGRRLTWSLGFGAVLSQVLNIALIPQYGFLGATTTSAIVHLLLAALLLAPTLRRVGVPLWSLPLIQCSAYGILLAGALALIRPFLLTDLQTLLGIVVLGLVSVVLVEILGLRRMFTAR